MWEKEGEVVLGVGFFSLSLLFLTSLLLWKDHIVVFFLKKQRVTANSALERLWEL